MSEPYVTSSMTEREFWIRFEDDQPAFDDILAHLKLAAEQIQRRKLERAERYMAWFDPNHPMNQL